MFMLYVLPFILLRELTSAILPRLKNLFATLILTHTFNLKLINLLPFIHPILDKRSTAAYGACTSTSGRIWAGSGYTSPQATWLTTAWGHAHTFGALKINILRYDFNMLVSLQKKPWE